ncbi:hypothetical protein CH063_04188 [Colletotrichum higginsianum]|uniref:Uncharacterized protein n=1 Tax=Colletotrichum higginsianum (strain IMI 349063) TaxID=759273 RepID=H1W4W5_COLHI|nr:hypothetical protein CH063_04188 [Colletotrichum higginsianum]
MYPRAERLLYRRQRPLTRQTRYWQSGSQYIHRKLKVYTDGVSLVPIQGFCMLTTVKVNIHLETLESKRGMAILCSVHRYIVSPVRSIYLSTR